MRSMLALLLLFVATFASAQTDPSFRIEPYKVTLGEIEIEAERGTLTVPQNRERRDSGTIELHFVRIRGTKPNGTPVLYLPGGPGGSATGLLRFPGAADIVAAFRSTGDFILLDQRGTGQSKPIPSCPPAGDPPLTAFSDTDALLKGMIDATARCANEWREKGVDISGFNSREAADDIDALRRALREEKISLVGFSYGTHLALATLRRHGEHLERVVLIGTEGPDHTQKLPSTLDMQLRKISALAAQDPAINRDVPDMLTLLQRVLKKLDAKPMEVTVRHPKTGEDHRIAVSGDGLRKILRYDVGDGNDFPVFPAMLHELDRGGSSILAGYVLKRIGGVAGGIGLMPIVTDCASGVSAQRLAQIRSEEASSILGRFTNDPFPDVCRAVGNPDLGEGYRRPIVSDVPVLFISGTLDSNTPPFQAEEVRWGLTRATHIIVDNAGHEDTFMNRDVGRAIVEFLSGGDVSGRAIALPKPKFLSIEAAKTFRP